MTSVASLAIAFFYMEKHLGLAPCPLCIIDRLFIGLITLTALFGWLHNPANTGQRIYSGCYIVFSGLGTAVAGRHIYLQNLDAAQLPDCLPDLDYMLEAFSWLETLTTIFNTSGECATVQWTFLGLSIPWQTLLLFIGLFILGIINLLLSLRKPRQLR